MSAERLDPHLFSFHLHLETCEQCRGPDKHLCALGLQLLFHAAQAGALDLATPIPETSRLPLPTIRLEPFYAHLPARICRSETHDLETTTG